MLGTVASRGQTVIPAEIRRRFNLTPAQRLEWVIEDGTIRVHPIARDPIAAFRSRGKGGGRTTHGEASPGQPACMTDFVLDTSALPTLRNDEPADTVLDRTSKNV